MYGVWPSWQCILRVWFWMGIFCCSVCFNNIHGFVKVLLQRPPIIERREQWSRTPVNLAVYGNFSLTLSRSLEVPTPSYVQILEHGTLSVTSFSLLRKGSVMQFDLNGVRFPRTMQGDYLWPNELTQYYDDYTKSNVMLVPDGFLMPGQSDGGVYAISNPENPSSRPVRITERKNGWFYHKALHVQLPPPVGEESTFGRIGTEGVLTARARKSMLGTGEGELVWLSRPDSRNGDLRGTDTERDRDASFKNNRGSTQKHAKMEKYINKEGKEDVYAWEPWEETVLASGPDVMFEVFDIDDTDDTLEVVSAQFFGQKLSVHSIRSTNTHPFIEVAESSTIRTEGKPYGLSLATISPPTIEAPPLEGDFAGGSRSPAGSRQKPTIPAKTAFRYKSKRRDKKGVVSGHAPQLQSVRYSERRGTDDPFIARDSSVPLELMYQGSNQCLCDNSHPTHLLVTTHECSYDLPSAFQMARGTIDGVYPRVKCREDGGPYRAIAAAEIAAGSAGGAEDLLGASPNDDGSTTGGSLFAYEIPLVRRKRESAANAKKAFQLNRDVGSSRIDLSAVLPDPGSGSLQYPDNARDSSGRSSSGKRGFNVSRIRSCSRSRSSISATSASSAAAVPSSSSFSARIVNRITGAHQELRVLADDCHAETASSISPHSPAGVHNADSHSIVSAQESSRSENIDRERIMGVDAKKLDLDQWQRSTIYQGFKVRGWGGIVSPGAPGFPYVFRMPNKPQSPPLILLAGDCTGSAYIFVPRGQEDMYRVSSEEGISNTNTRSHSPSRSHTRSHGARSPSLRAEDSSLAGGEVDSWKTATISSGRAVARRVVPGAPLSTGMKAAVDVFLLENLLSEDEVPDELDLAADNIGASSFSRASNEQQRAAEKKKLPNYVLAFEIECGATVGSAAVASTNDNTGDVYLYIPSYELNKVHVFRLSDRLL